MAEIINKPAGEMDWLHAEFNLTDEQFSKIKVLQEAYEPKCDQMCMRIREANANLDQLITANTTMTPQVEAALRECASVQADCRREMLRHIYTVSAEMNPDSRERYLRMMKRYIIEQRLAPDIAVSKPETGK